MSFLRLLTLQIVEGKMTVEQARAIVIARAERNRSYATAKLQGRHTKPGPNGLLARVMAAGAH